MFYARPLLRDLSGAAVFQLLNTFFKCLDGNNQGIEMFCCDDIASLEILDVSRPERGSAFLGFVFFFHLALGANLAIMQCQ